jgi:hypothetical protein
VPLVTVTLAELLMEALAEPSFGVIVTLASEASFATAASPEEFALAVALPLAAAEPPPDLPPPQAVSVTAPPATAAAMAASPLRRVISGRAVVAAVP